MSEPIQPLRNNPDEQYRLLTEQVNGSIDIFFR